MVCAHTGCVLSKLHGQQHPHHHLVQLPCRGVWGLEERALLFTQMRFFGLQQTAYVSCRPGTPSESGICMLTGVMGSCQVWAKPLESSVLCSTVPGVELWAYPTFELHGWQWHVDLGIFFSHHADCPSDQEWISNSVVYRRRKKGRTDADGILQLEWSEPALASTSQELACVHWQKPASAWFSGELVSWGDILGFVSRLFMAPKNCFVCPWLVAYTTFFT